jgi:hypothetical protein
MTPGTTASEQTMKPSRVALAFPTVSGRAAETKDLSGRAALSSTAIRTWMQTYRGSTEAR